MSQIIKQPNGKFCIFSGVVDNVTHYDMTPEEIVDIWVEEYKKDITKKVDKIIDKLEKCKKPYYQFTIDYNEMMETIEQVHGVKKMRKVKEIIENESR